MSNKEEKDEKALDLKISIPSGVYIAIGASVIVPLIGMIISMITNRKYKSKNGNIVLDKIDDNQKLLEETKKLVEESKGSIMKELVEIKHSINNQQLKLNEFDESLKN